jgi:chromosome segregation ATPase
MDPNDPNNMTPEQLREALINARAELAVTQEAVAAAQEAAQEAVAAAQEAEQRADAAEKAKDDAEKAKEAAEKAKDDAERTAGALRYVWLLRNRCSIQHARTTRLRG